MGRYSDDVIERFRAQVDRTDDSTACWPWTGPTHANGYGIFNVGRRQVLVHRFSLELSGVEIPPGFVVMQSCRNRLCCNPAHLRAATHAEQMAARSRLRRLPRPDEPAKR